MSENIENSPCDINTILEVASEHNDMMKRWGALVMINDKIDRGIIKSLRPDQHATILHIACTDRSGHVCLKGWTVLGTIKEKIPDVQMDLAKLRSTLETITKKAATCADDFECNFITAKQHWMVSTYPEAVTQDIAIETALIALSAEDRKDKVVSFFGRSVWTLGVMAEKNKACISQDFFKMLDVIKERNPCMASRIDEIYREDIGRHRCIADLRCG